MGPSYSSQHFITIIYFQVSVPYSFLVLVYPFVMGCPTIFVDHFFYCYFFLKRELRYIFIEEITNPLIIISCIKS